MPGLGFALAAGGRYDGLLERFGAARPATGFGIAVPHLHQAIVAEGWSVGDESPLVVLERSSDDVGTLRAATALRGAGLAVAIGDVAETAGRAVVRATVVDERHVRYEGATRTIDELVGALRR